MAKRFGDGFYDKNQAYYSLKPLFFVSHILEGWVVSRKRYVQVLTPVPMNVTLFRNRVFADMIKDIEMRSS